MMISATQLEGRRRDAVPPCLPAIGQTGDLGLRNETELGTFSPSWQQVLVYGLGLSGVAVSRLLLDCGVIVTALDDRDDIALPADLLSHSGFSVIDSRSAQCSSLADVDLVVKSPGVPGDRVLLERAREQSIPLVSEIEIAYRVLVSIAPSAQGRLVAITGSNGKSTTTQLTGDLLEGEGAPVKVCGNIGVPLSSCVTEFVRAGREVATLPFFVVELSSFQLLDIDHFRPRAGALLNLSPDHLDRHGTEAGYLQAKRRLFENQSTGDVAVLNADDPRSAQTSLNEGVRRRLFSIERAVDDGCYVSAGEVVMVEPGSTERVLFRRSDLSVVGSHNLENAMAAALLADAMGVTPDAVPARLVRFRGLPHRTELIARRGGVSWYDDSKGTNVGAVTKSLEGFAGGSVHLILGGRAKGGDFSGLRASVATKAARLYLIGEAASQLATDLSDLVPIERADTMDVAVRRAHEFATPGQVVLLSPACASFDQFENFAHRGRVFQELVRAALGTSAVSSSGSAAQPESSDRGGAAHG